MTLDYLQRLRSKNLTDKENKIVVCVDLEEDFSNANVLICIISALARKW